ncbi:hypothetical protein MT418_003350 [Batrachochytrium dendrobatidis]
MPASLLFPVVKVSPLFVDTAYVTRHDKYSDSSLSTQVYYTVQVCPSIHDINASVENHPLSHLQLPVAPTTLYKIQRRFEDFVGFHGLLANHLSKMSSYGASIAKSLPQLPRRRIFVSASVCNDRVVLLDQYVKHIFMLPSIATSSPVVLQFFGMWQMDMDPRQYSEEANAMVTKKASAIHSKLPPLRKYITARNSSYSLPNTASDALNGAHNNATAFPSDTARNAFKLPASNLSLQATPVVDIYNSDSFARAHSDYYPTGKSHLTAFENYQLASPLVTDQMDDFLDEDWLEPIMQRRMSQLTLVKSVTDLSSQAPHTTHQDSVQSVRLSESYAESEIDDVLDSYSLSQSQIASLAVSAKSGLNSMQYGESKPNLKLSEKLTQQSSTGSSHESYKDFVTNLARNLGIDTRNSILDSNNSVNDQTILNTSIEKRPEFSILAGEQTRSPHVSGTSTAVDPNQPSLYLLMTNSVSKSAPKPSLSDGRNGLFRTASPSIPSRGNSKFWREESTPIGQFNSLPNSAPVNLQSLPYEPIVERRRIPDTEYATVASRDNLPTLKGRSKSHDHNGYLLPASNFTYNNVAPHRSQEQLRTRPSLSDVMSPIPRSTENIESLKSTLNLLRDRKPTSEDSASMSYTKDNSQSFSFQHSAQEQLGTAPIYSEPAASRSDKIVSTLIRNLSFKRTNILAENALVSEPDSINTQRNTAPWNRVPGAALPVASNTSFALPSSVVSAQEPRQVRAGTLPRKSSLRRIISRQNVANQSTQSAEGVVPVNVASSSLITTLVRNLSKKKNKRFSFNNSDSTAIPNSSASGDIAATSTSTTQETDPSIAPWNRLQTPPPTIGGTLLRGLSINRRNKSANDIKTSYTATAPKEEPVPISFSNSFETINAEINARRTEANLDTSDSLGVRSKYQDVSLAETKGKTIKSKVSFGNGLASSNADYDDIYLPADYNVSAIARTARAIMDSEKGALFKNRQIVPIAFETQLLQTNMRYRTDIMQDARRKPSLKSTKINSPKLFRSHTLSAGSPETEAQHHFISIRAISDASVVVSIKISRTVDFAAVLDKLAMRFATHENSLARWKRFPGHFGKQIVAIKSITYKDVDAHLINIKDEEDWVVCLDESIQKEKLTLLVQIESIYDTEQ